jgi:uncharacterized MAPEG superfamily protein
MLMDHPTALSLTVFISWSLGLLILMEAIRCKLVLSGEVPSNGFSPDNSNLSPFMQRLSRAHLNCLEGLPIFGGLMVVALITGRSHITDGLALVLVGARILQSTIHLFSVSKLAVNARFTAFAVQMGIAAYWSCRMLA